MRVFVAMSGGVDSSVAAALLVEQGHDVTGVTMQLWPSSDEEGGCCSVSAVRDARRVCDMLGIPHYALDYRDTFEREVIGSFADEYSRGRTPNPCIVCNDRLKFSDLLSRVSLQGADALATGHYARILRGTAGEPQLARGVDPEKDQSYFLYRLTPVQMEHVLFPLGEMCKSEVRAVAERMGLPTAAKAESQDICFATGGDHLPVIRERAPGSLRPGPIVDESGAVLGEHEGIARFTIGQRKGIGVGGVAEPLYVLRVEADSATVVVGPRSSLRVHQVEAGDVVWRGSELMTVGAMVRYRSEPVPARVTCSGENLSVTFDEAVEGVAPGQSVVCYDGDVVIGGGYVWSAS